MMLTIPRLLVAVAAAAALSGCGTPQPRASVPQASAAPTDSAETIYLGGDIVTINDRQPSAEALAVKGGKILAVGARADVELSGGALPGHGAHARS